MLGKDDNKIKLQFNQTNALVAENINPGTTRNHLSVAMKIIGEINVPIFEEALAQLIIRHEMLRAKLSYDEPFFEIIPLPLLPSNDTWPLTEIDASDMNLKHDPTVKTIETILNTCQRLDILRTPFLIYQEPLWRSALIKVAKEKHLFLLLFNHMIVDTVSVNIIIENLSSIYNTILDNSNSFCLPTIPSLKHLNFDLDAESFQKRLNFWQENLADLCPVNLSHDVYLRKTAEPLGERMNFRISQEVIKQLTEHPDMKNSSFFQKFIACVFAVIFKYTDSTAICVGFTSANRKHDQIAESTMNTLVNCFSNSIPLYLKFSKGNSFIELLQLTQTSLKKALRNQLPLNDIMQKALTIETKQRLGIAVPFTIFVSENKKKTTLTLSKTRATYPQELDLHGLATFHDFGFNLNEHPDGSYQCFIEYNATLYSKQYINYFILQIKKILIQVSHNPFIKLNDINILLEDQKNKIEQFNATDKPFQDSFQSFFQNTAFSNLRKPAISYHDMYGDGNDRLSIFQIDMNYAELEQTTTQIANYLMSLGVNSSIPIGVCVKRSKVIPSMISVLKSGGILVTMETEYCEPLYYKITSTKMRFALTDNETSHLFDNTNITTINLDDEHFYSKDFQHYFPPQLEADDIAYIMFTSGTTGVPNGVMITQIGLANLCFAQLHLHLNDNSQVLCTADPTFDAIFWDIVRVIASGGTLHITPAHLRNSLIMLEYLIENNHVNEAALLPELLGQLSPSESMTHVVSMGATPNEKVMRHWKKENPSTKMFNGWGPTEITVQGSLEIYDPNRHPNNIGKPIPNHQIYILNPNNLSLCPYNVSGELYVGGLGLALGYLNNPTLTKEKFIFGTFDYNNYQFKTTDDKNESTITLYKTGDFGCYRHIETDDNTSHSTTIEFMGRKDRRIKIHGVSLDLDNLEANLWSNFSFVENVKLICVENQALIVYIVPKGEIFDIKNVYPEIHENFQKKCIPSVAFPKNIIFLEEFPTNKNGKIDVNALPSYKTTNLLPSNQPLTDRQKILQQLWADILYCPKEKIDINYTFLELGGNSLSLAMLGAKLHENFNFIKNKFIWIKILSMHMTIFTVEKAINSYEHNLNTVIFNNNIQWRNDNENSNARNSHNLFPKKLPTSLRYQSELNEKSKPTINPK